ncbi:hypothetical protein OIV83_002936 [Microbotryomycetes sp. JL201]|nr:hypothetical protein OIV83_002936 [Microbotryomycetes sp. JL201]
MGKRKSARKPGAGKVKQAPLDLTEPIDIYSDWIDASVAANSAAARRQAAAAAASGGAGGDRPGTGAAGAGPRGKSPILPGASAARERNGSNKDGQQPKKRKRTDGYESEGMDDEDADSNQEDDNEDDDELPDLRSNKKSRPEQDHEDDGAESDSGSRQRLTNRSKQDRVDQGAGQDDDEDGGDGPQEQVQRRTRVLSDDEEE